MRNLADANLMGGTAEVKNAVMNAAAAAHPACSWRRRSQKPPEISDSTSSWVPIQETADAFIAAFHRQRAIVFNLEIDDGDVRVSQLHARRFNMLIQTAASRNWSASVPR
ncbi:hypothetical protein MJ560_06595 [Klebsiella pneumoniae]|nr:hypothetical protein MJ560_06595 [Klebsiella pneumoniae]